MSRPWTIGRLTEEVVDLLEQKPARVERGNLTFDHGPLQSSLWIWKDVHNKAAYGWAVVTYDVALYDRMKTFGGPGVRIEHPAPTGSTATSSVPQPACYTWSANGGLSAEAAASVNEHALDCIGFVRDQHDLGQLLLARTHVQRGNVWSFAPDGAGIGVIVPVRRPRGRTEQALHADTRTTNNLIRSIRALGERAAAELRQRWRTLQRVTLSPSRIGDIARAALALNRVWNDHR